jgi:histone H3/H4
MGKEGEPGTSRELPIATMQHLIKKAGAKRVSRGAALALAEILEQDGREIAIEATRLAEHAGRKTITGTDIRLAVKMQ